MEIIYVCIGNKLITKGQSEQPCLAHLSLVIDDKLCNLCYNEVKSIVNALDVKDLEFSPLSEETSPDSTPLSSQDMLVDVSATSTSVVSSVCAALQVSPWNKDKHYRDSSHKQNAIKRKADKITSCVIDNLSSSLQVPVPYKKSLSEIEQHSLDYDRLLSDLAEKIKISKSFSERKMLLTLAPSSWSREKVVQFFQVGDFTVRSARALKEDCGILASPKPKKSGQTLPEQHKEILTQFFLDEEISRWCPGVKDYKSTRINLNGEKVRISRRLLLFNLKEAHYLFQQQHPEIKVGLSKFCSLRPEWVRTVNSSGAHNVCVCIHHQNPKLMIKGGGIIEDYKDLMFFLVCSLSDEQCMLFQNDEVKKCSKCPSSEALEEHILQQIENFEQIDYSEWTTVDRTTMVKVTQNVSEFASKLVCLLQGLCAHHFMAKVQAAFYKSSKDNIMESECVVTLDFAENFTFQMQDEVQGAHWTSVMATLHPFVIYYIINGERKNKSYCVISDCLKHDATAVNCFIKLLVEEIKLTIPDLSKIIFFSDGGPAHYKNKYNFANLSMFKNDFGIMAEWHFWATCHGKNACDGIGGTVKRLARRASLQRPIDNQILTPSDLFSWASESIEGIKFFYVNQSEIDVNSENLLSRFEKVVTIKGTHKLHCFIPLSNGVIEVSRTSCPDSKLEKQIAVVLPQPYTSNISLSDVAVDDFLVIVVDNKWWIGRALEVDADGVNLEVFKENGPSKTYSLNSQSNEFYVNSSQIILKIEKPTPRTRSGRTYVIPNNVTQNIVKLFNRYIVSRM